MIDTAGDRVAALHTQAVEGSATRFCASLSVPPAEDLHLEVTGLGRLQLPVPEAQAKQLCQLSRPARYGKGELTLLDRSVRDTWEVPKSRIKIDKRRWDRTLQPALESLRRDLGLPDGCSLEAQMHSMLVYAPGQFFVEHQDSEKDDSMVGSLVVTLPGSFTGGALEVSHGGQTVAYRGSKKYLSLVAFYSDCRHQIKPVKSGHRVVLTYNLLRRGQADGTVPDPGQVADLSGAIGEYFAGGGEVKRMVSLLDHEYTQRGLSWSRLKGSDAKWAELLRTAAERMDCEIALALVDVQETWSAYDRWERAGHSRYHRRDDDYDEDDWYESPNGESSVSGGTYELDELIESQYRIESWIDPTSGRLEMVGLDVPEVEVCAATPSGDLEPYHSEYEGYMGNWGNTLDRWYHRGALVVWPRSQAFAMRAEISPAWALEGLEARLKRGDLGGAHDAAVDLEPFWAQAVSRVESERFFIKGLRVAQLIADPEIASMLLRPFRIELVTSTHAKPLAALLDRYGQTWFEETLTNWSGRQLWDARRERWITSLPRLCHALVGAGGSGPGVARLLVSRSWQWVARGIERALDTDRPSSREKAIAELAGATTAVIESAAQLDAQDLLEESIELLCSGGEELLACAMSVLRRSESARWRSLGLDRVAAHWSEVLEAGLARPARQNTDWSVTLPAGCQCELCQELDRFLTNPAVTSFEWPLRKDRRTHVHNRIDAAELPVDHETRRKGSPFTLVLNKTDDIFKREENARRRNEQDLVWLKGTVRRRYSCS